MHKLDRWRLLTLCGVLLVNGARAMPAESGIEEIQLQHLEAKNVLTMVRTLAGTTRVHIANERTLRIQSTPDKVLVARKAIELTEGAKAAPAGGVKYEVGDGTVVACIALRHASGSAAMAALRSLEIRQIAVVSEPPTALVRASAEQAEAALAKLRELDREPPTKVGTGTDSAAVATPRVAAPSAADPAGGEVIQLVRLEAQGAMTLLRSIAGVSQVEIVDGHTLRVQGTPDKVRLARKVVELAEAAGGPAAAEARYDVGDGTVVACAALRHSASNEMMAALRAQGISRMAVVNQPAMILVRDSAAQVTAGLELIRAKDPAAP